ncbi:MAG: carbohydrate ABC transporter permease [Caldilineaceae bacterium]|nr:carbohydrate ABC transporter permease [Caldilineaceae bacterium]
MSATASTSTTATPKRHVIERQMASVQRRRLVRWFMGQLFLWTIILAGLIFMITPGIWMILASFKTQSEISAIPLRFFPEVWRVSNYPEAAAAMKFWAVFRNSLLITGAITVANVFTCTWGGYTFGKLRWPGRDVVFMLLLSTMMIPGFLTLIRRYVLVAKMGLLNSYGGMIIPFLTGTFGIFLTKQFMLGIPDELIDAATVDGSSAFGIYWRIILPLSKPIIAVLSIFVFDWAWDDLLWGIMILTDREMWTLPIAIANLRIQQSNQYELQMAGSTVAIIPVILLFLVLQRHIVQGVALSGLKG